MTDEEKDIFIKLKIKKTSIPEEFIKYLIMLLNCNKKIIDENFE